LKRAGNLDEALSFY
jgi:tetratricopeptide (TPR) repeat protein